MSHFQENVPTEPSVRSLIRIGFIFILTSAFVAWMLIGLLRFGHELPS